MKIGIIGGTGLDNPDILTHRTEHTFDKSEVRNAANGLPADYGEPSDNLIIGQVGGVDCVILARHGRRHHLSPTAVNYRANMLALKQAGCDIVIAVHSVGSLEEDYKPGDFVLIDQLVDRTQKRELSYYDCKPTSWEGIMHCSFGDPYDTVLRKLILEISEQSSYKLHPKGTCVAIEGPRFSSRAESLMYRLWNCHLIGMTQVPEAQLAKELDLPFVAIGMVTDYDSWKISETPVTTKEVIQALKRNGNKMVDFLKYAIPIIAKSEKWREDSNVMDAVL